jgi:hypothetical protein
MRTYLLLLGDVPPPFSGTIFGIDAKTAGNGKRLQEDPQDGGAIPGPTGRLISLCKPEPRRVWECLHGYTGRWSGKHLFTLGEDLVL